MLPDDVRAAWWWAQERQERVDRHPWGVAASDTRWPRVWDANFVRVERAHVTLAGVERAMATVLERTGGNHARLWVPEPERVPGFVESAVTAGYGESRDLAMVLDGSPPEAPAGAMADVREVPHGAPDLVRALYQFRDTSQIDDEVMQQLLRRDAWLATLGGVRWFAGYLDGELAGFCGCATAPNGVSMIDDVTTGEAFRRKGVATLVVAAATFAAQAASGVSRTFLSTAADNAPAIAVYERLGFRPIGEVVDLHRGPPGSSKESSYPDAATTARTSSA